MRVAVFCVVLPLFGVGCGESHEPPDDLVELVLACAPEMAACGREAGPCCEGHCFDTGYGEGTCLPRLDDGQFCLEDDACRNGRCVDNVCGTGIVTCAAEGASCSDSPCCGDLVCWESTCITQRADGEACSAAGQCASGQCNSEGVCGPETTTECVAEGMPCGFGHGGECCGGRECRWISYGIATCIFPKPLGAACVYSDECDSHICSDGLCRNESCEPELGTACTYDHQCCTGFCTGGDYIAGACTARLEAGAFCNNDNWCQSYSCTFNTCD